MAIPHRLAILAASIILWTTAATGPIIVSGGPENDYESWIARLADQRLMVLFDRNPDWASGDLYVTFSDDGGDTWSHPHVIIADPGDQATLSFVQLPSDTIRLWYASNETGTYRIHTAWSLDGLTWTKKGQIDFGWSGGTMYYDPTVVLEPDSSLTMSYVVSGSGVYIAHQPYGGAWDTDKTQVAPSGYRPRVMKHSNGTYLYAYHTRTGGTYEYDVFVKTSTDRVNWSSPTQLTTNRNSHDPFPNEMSDGAYTVYYAKHDGTVYNLCRRRSFDAVFWEAELRVTNDPTNNTQPHFFDEENEIYMVWAHAVDYPNNHDVYFERSVYLPQVVSVQPSRNETAAARSCSVMVAFNTPMNVSSIDSTSFYVYGSLSGPHSGLYSYDDPSQTVTFIPTHQFAAGEMVTVGLSQNIVSSLGLPMEHSLAWWFHTESAQAGALYEQSAYVSGSEPRDIAAADLDSDGDNDLAVVCFDADSMTILLNDGAGTFGTHAAYAVGDQPNSVFAADFDGDGDLDVAVANGWSNDVSVLFNQGDATFILSQDYPVGSYPRSIVATDLNGDNHIDLATVNMDGWDLSMLLNNGDGTFADVAFHEIGLGHQPASLAPGDFDNDGLVDLAVVGWVELTDNFFLCVVFNHGSWQFVTGEEYAVGTGPNSIAVGDFNHDGYPDCACAHFGHWGSEDSTVLVLMNQGNGTFEEPDVYVVGRPRAIRTSDLNGDSHLDLVACDQDDGTVAILFGAGNSTMSTPSFFPAGSSPVAAAIADFNGDSVLDLATADWSADFVTVLLNTEGLCGDINGDGLGPNIVDVTYLVAYLFSGGPPPPYPLLADINGADGAVNIVDLTYLANYLFGGGPDPDCGTSP